MFDGRKAHHIGAKEIYVHEKIVLEEMVVGLGQQEGMRNNLPAMS